MMSRQWKREPQYMLDKECVEYFRAHPVFDRLLKGFRKKYVSYGTFAGTVMLRNITGKEMEDLEGFFQKNYHGQKSVSILAAQFERALKDSRFGSLTPKEVLELYFQEEMTGKKEQKREEEKRWQQIFAKVQERYEGTPAAEWIEEVQHTGKVLSSYILKRYRESGKNINEAERLLLLGAHIINNLPYRQGETEYLAVFASRITGNPHAFDDGAKDGQFLRLLVHWTVEKQQIGIKKSGVFPSLVKQRLYLAAGILRDDISNYAMVSGVRAWKKNGEIHSGMEGFLQEGDMVQVSLSVIADWKRIECPEHEIYIVENPSVYAILCVKWRGKKACMCMNGQPRLSSVLILDLLAEANVKVYYAGDFDPEGLMIAQKVKQYYKGEFSYWCMSRTVYEKSRSSEPISEKRLKMLGRIVDAELTETAQAVRNAKVAGYQENIWEEFGGKNVRSHHP